MPEGMLLKSGLESDLVRDLNEIILKAEANSEPDQKQYQSVTGKEYDNYYISALKNTVKEITKERPLARFSSEVIEEATRIESARPARIMHQFSGFLNQPEDPEKDKTQGNEEAYN